MPVALTVAPLMLAGCGGGGDNPARAEAILRQYISTLTPETAPFLIGAGPPQVRKNSCKKLRDARLRPGRRVRKDTLQGTSYLRIPNGTVFWSCAVTVGKHYKVDAVFAMNKGGEIFNLGAMPPKGAPAPPPLPPATTYEGGPKQPKP